uniref:Ig-like domain-containing protein n=1 Tax=Seriola lalandi dorsalis TaxID=1841481 RepID=A0A3B4WGD6_SERLL
MDGRPENNKPPTLNGAGKPQHRKLHILVWSADVRIVPSRLQLFDHESVSFSCQGFNVSAGWRVRNIKNRTSCLMSTVTCTNNYALVSDSGEYWCEALLILPVNMLSCCSGGSVILESPVLPVREGESVSLRCRTRKDVSDLTADFYKDGLLIGSSSTGNITIENVSRSDDGLYKCNISGAGESPQSQLMVTGETLAQILLGYCSLSHSEIQNGCHFHQGQHYWQ